MRHECVARRVIKKQGRRQLRVELFADGASELGRRERVEASVHERCICRDLWSDELMDEAIQRCSGRVTLSDGVAR